MLTGGPPPLAAGLVITAIPLALLVWILIGRRRGRSLLDGGERTVGEIVGKTTKNTGDDTVYLVHVVFQDHNGIDITKKFKVGQRAHSMLKVGDSLPVMFDTRKPKRARLGPPDLLPDVLQGDPNTWLLAIIFFAFFALFVLGVVMVVAVLTGHWG